MTLIQCGPLSLLDFVQFAILYHITFVSFYLDFLLLIFIYRFSLLSMWWLLCIISKGFSLQKCSKLLLPLLYLLACKLPLFSFFNIFIIWQNTNLIPAPFALFALQGSVLCCASSTCSIGSFKSDKGMEWTKFEST
jgi:hypothetical protein